MTDPRTTLETYAKRRFDWRYDRDGDPVEFEFIAPEAIAALRKVLAIHNSTADRPDMLDGYCCGDHAYPMPLWPCATVRAITEALGGDDAD